MGEYAGTDYTVFADGERIQEVCAAEFGSLPGSSEIAAVLNEMRSFFDGLREAMQSPALSGLMNNPFETMNKIQGIPVRTRMYSNGALQQELVLSSAESSVELDAALFEPPANYTERSLIPGDR